MDSARSISDKQKLIAFVLPMVVFLFLLALASGLEKIGGPFWVSSPQYWLYPVQTLLCGALAIWRWHAYDLQAPRRVGFAVAVGIVVFALWIAPQAFFAFPPRLGGFNPQLFIAQPALYWATLAFRFLRLVVVVPVVEEIFWRGFLLRYFINEKFYAVPIGTFSWLSFTIVSLAFGFSHAPADWSAGVVTGALYNAVAYRTKSLASCVVAHAITNLLLGLWIMHTRQWGFW